MTKLSMRLGAAAFVVLAAGVAINMMLLQSADPRRAKSAAERARKPAPVAAAAAIPAGPAPAEASRSAKAAQAKPAPETVAQTAAPVGSDLVKQIQRELAARGYETAVDGNIGLVTRAAIMAFETDRGLPVTAEPSPQLLKAITSGTARMVAASSMPRGATTKEAEQVIRTVQQSLAALSYLPGKIDGRMGEETVRAIREFEMDQSLPETGRISGQLVSRLAGIAGQGRLARVR